MEFSLDEIQGVFEKERYYAKLGELYVTHVWNRNESIQFCLKRSEADDMLSNTDVKWLVKNVPGIKLFKVKITVQETEVDEALIF